MKQSVALIIAAVLSCVGMAKCVEPKYAHYFSLMGILMILFSIASFVMLIVELNQGKWDDRVE